MFILYARNEVCLIQQTQTLVNRAGVVPRSDMQVLDYAGSIPATCTSLINIYSGEIGNLTLTCEV